MATAVMNYSSWYGDFDGTGWKPYVILTDASGNPISIGGSGASAQQVQGNVASGVADSGNPVKIGGIYNSALPTFTTGQRSDIQTDVNGNLRAVLAGGATTATDGATNSLAYVYAGNTQTIVVRPLATAPFKSNGSTWDRDRKPNNSSRIVSSAASTNATVAKASAGDLHTAIGNNTNAAIIYLKIYDKATAPVVGTDTPDLTIPLKPLDKFEVDLKGMYFASGISYALTTGTADSDTGAVAAGDILGLNLIFA